jgi:release factor glutamine methyltransferase
MTLDAALKLGAEKISKRDAKILLSHVSGYSTSGILLHCLRTLSDDEKNLYFALVQRRQAGEPLQYIIGSWDFMGLCFKTDKRALIPRPETELLVEEVQRHIETTKKPHVKILDVCTGTGCIAISLACILGEQAEITATDISPDALSLARENAEKLGVTHVKFLQSDLLENITGEFDIIVSNPPYILSGDMATLSSTVRDYEPHLALNGGADGLEIYRKLIPQAKNALLPDGALFLEIGPPSVLKLMEEAGFVELCLLRDYSEIERIVVGKVEAWNG